ncbi:MAG: sensor histidine kinase [Clostridia bacterium]
MGRRWNESFPFRVAVRTGIAVAFVCLLMIGAALASVAYLTQKQVDASLLADANKLVLAWSQSGYVDPNIKHDGYFGLLDEQGRVVQEVFEDEDDHRLPLLQGNYRWKSYPVFSYIVPAHDGQPAVRNPSFSLRLLGNEHNYRELQYPFEVSGVRYSIVVTEEIEDSLHFLTRLTILFLVIATLGIVIITSIVVYSAKQGFRPVRQIAEKLMSIEEQTLSSQIDLPVRDRTLAGLLASLNQMLSRLHQSFALQSRFVQDASHELKTPLAVLRSDLEVTLRRERSSAEYIDCLSRCLRETEHMTQLTQQLLMLARIDRSPNVSLQPVVLQDLLDQTIRRISMNTHLQAPEIVCRLCSGIVIMAEPASLEVVFTNLLTNAAQAIEGASGGKIEIVCERQPDHYRISITDNGRGIPEAALPHLFERFYRVDESRNRQSGGTGLGLSICQTIIKAHHGTITVKSKPNEGSTFTITLPAGQPLETKANNHPSP